MGSPVLSVWGESGVVMVKWGSSGWWWGGVALFAYSCLVFGDYLDHCNLTSRE